MMLPKELLTDLEQGDRTGEWLEPKAGTIDDMYRETFESYFRSSPGSNQMFQQSQNQLMNQQLDAMRNAFGPAAIFRPGHFYKLGGQ